MDRESDIRLGGDNEPDRSASMRLRAECPRVTRLSRKVLAGAPLAEDRGDYLQGVNAVAGAVPGGVVFVAGFADRLDSDRLSEVGERLQRLLAGSEAGRTAVR